MDTIDTYDWEAANDQPQPLGTANNNAVFDQALAALAAFDQTFGRPITPSFVAEMYVARIVGLRLRSTPNAPGFERALDRIRPTSCRLKIVSLAMMALLPAAALFNRAPQCSGKQRPPWHRS